MQTYSNIVNNLSLRHQTALKLAINKLKDSRFCHDIIAGYLYGSCARGDAKYSSDVDLFFEIRADFPRDRTGEIVSMFGMLSSDRLEDPEIDAHFSIGHDWSNGELTYYKEILREGVQIWPEII